MVVLITLFNGASIANYALDKAGINIVATYSSEVDKHALIHEKHHYPQNIQLGDVSKIDFIALKKEIESKYPNSIILLFGGSPCQNLSFAGNRKGMSTKCNIQITELQQYLSLKKGEFEFSGYSYLFWEYMRAKEELQPDFYFLENVKMSMKNKKVFDNAIGDVGVLYDSELVSAQQRKRYYWFNWWKPQIKDRGIELKDVLDYTQPFRPLGAWVNSVWKGGKDKKIGRLRTVYDEKAFTLTTSKTHSWQYYLNKNRDMYRNLTPNEYEKLQTFPVDYTKVNGIPNGQRYKLIGNSWTAEMVIELLQPLSDIILDISEVK